MYTLNYCKLEKRRSDLKSWARKKRGSKILVKPDEAPQADID